MKRVFALILALTLCFGLSIAASAAIDSDEFESARSVRVTLDDRTIRVDDDTYGDFTVSNDDAVWDEVIWSTSDSDIVDVDRDGTITGVYPGRATITVRLRVEVTDNNGRTTTRNVGSGSTTIIVTGSRGYYDDRYYDDEYWDDYWDDYYDGGIDYTAGDRTPVNSGSGSRSAMSNGTLGASTMDSGIKSTSGISATFNDYDTVTASTLKTAAASAPSGMSFHFDTTNGGSVEGRLTVTAANAANVTNSIDLRVFTNRYDVGDTVNTFESTFQNDLVVAKAEQSGSYGTTVKVAVKVGSAISSSSDLRVYRYVAGSGTYSEMTGATPWMDNNGYVHFYTTMGDYFIVSDGKLTK